MNLLIITLKNFVGFILLLCHHFSKKKKIRTLHKWKDLKKGLSKLKIQSSFGQPDRKGKFSNGDEFWGFQNYTLKFDKNGILKTWSKPFIN